ncbi:MAG: VWA domain-containing protein [Armatimonadota bacterium]|nr:VWA domain-containing protein [Armatimonadota bacterium]
MARYRGGRSRSYDGSEHNPWHIGLLLAAIAIGVLAASWLFWNYSQSRALRLPLAVGAGFDVSKSVTTRQKQQSVAFLNKMIGTVLPARTPIKIWRYAEVVETVHEGRPLASRELGRVSRDTIENYLGKWGTRPDKVMREFQRYLDSQPGRKFVLCLFTDGESHDAEQTRALAEQLARDERVVAFIVGPVLTRYRSAVENDYYAPLRQARKLFVFSETDALDTLERVKDYLFTLQP